MITARDAYYLTFDSIQKDVQAYGPIEASFDVYDDFVRYKSGQFRKTVNHKIMFFSINIIQLFYVYNLSYIML